MRRCLLPVINLRGCRAPARKYSKVFNQYSKLPTGPNCP